MNRLDEDLKGNYNDPGTLGPHKLPEQGTRIPEVLRNNGNHYSGNRPCIQHDARILRAQWRPLIWT